MVAQINGDVYDASTQASVSAAAALASQTAAASSASAALASKNAAASSASAAAVSQTAAASSASAAAVSQTAASSSASAAAVSKTAAASSASAAAVSQTAAATSANIAIAAPGTNATSSTGVTIGYGSKSFTIQTGKSIVVGMTLKIAYTTTPTNWMLGDVTSYNSGTGALTVYVSTIQGSGTYSSWTMSITAPSINYRESTITAVATAGQTVFSVAYTPGAITVYQNGSRLLDSDFTATTGTSITLVTPATAADEFTFVLNTSTGDNSAALAAVSQTVAASSASAAAVSQTAAASSASAAASSASAAAVSQTAAASSASAAAVSQTAAASSASAAASSASAAAVSKTAAAVSQTAAASSASAAASSASAAATSASTAINAPGTSATSTTSVSIGLGSKTLVTQASKLFSPGMTLKIANTASPTNWMLADIISYNSTTGDLVVNSSAINGSGTFSTWTITVSGPGCGYIVPAVNVSVTTAGSIASITVQEALEELDTEKVSLAGSYANPSWIASLAESKVLASQTGNSNKFYKTNGTTGSWAPIAFTETSFTATASQTVFNVTYSTGSIEVYQNGVRLILADFTASNGTSITLATPATAGDLVTFVVWG